jgi:hypothetical protein
MQKLGLGVVIALTFAALSYAATVAFEHDHPHAAVQAAVKRSPQDTAARERMARLVAEVAARSAAQTAKQVAMQHLQQRAAADKAAAIAAGTTVASSR